MPSALATSTPLVQVDISRCDLEPVRVPGAIQPHGALLVLDRADLGIVGASANSAGILGLSVHELLGHDLTLLARVANASDVETLARGLSDDRFEENNPFKITIGGRRLNVISHRLSDRIVVECEPEDDAPEFRAGYVFNRVQQSLTRLRAAVDLRTLCEHTAEEVRQLTGFDRVIIYAFQPDWSGRVVAESCHDGSPRYLDLRFPASDIPSQARALYAECRIRTVPTSVYDPAPIILQSGQPSLDLTHAGLRSISPVHLEYMRNMGVTASMGISIMDGDRLWGLITCNHETGDRFIPYEARSACGLLGEVVSSLIGQKIGTGVAEARAGYLDTQARLVQFIVQDGDVVNGLLRHSPSILEVTNSKGAVLFYNNEIHAVGQTPPHAELGALVAWVDQQDSGTLVIESLPDRYPAALAWRDVACGMIARPISFADSSVVSKSNWLLWFRPEVAQTVSWGGDPRKQSSLGTNERLHPRKSFERWREDVHLQSIPFLERDIMAATSLAADLVDVVLEIEASRQIREHSRLLDLAHRQLQLVLDATGEGLISVGRDGRLLAERSRAFSSWFPLAAPGAFIWQVLFPKDHPRAQEFAALWWQLVSDNLPFDVCVDQMCKELTREAQCLEIGYKEVREGRALSSILITLEDVTERVAARRAAREAAEGQALDAWALRDARGLRRALGELTTLSQAARDSASPVDARRALHTLKGNAAVLGLLTVPECCHEVEERVSERGDQGCATALEMSAIDAQIACAMERVRDVAGEEAFDRIGVPIAAIERAIEHLQTDETTAATLAELKRWLLDPAGRQLSKLAERAKRLARMLDKTVEVIVVDGDVRMAPDAFEPLWGALAHAVSNAVDHGIEAESLRRERGKTAAGHIRISAEYTSDGGVAFEIADDGGGVDLVAIRAAALLRGLPCLTHEQLLEALFTDGLSARAEVTQSSGRGVGLAALRQTCSRFGATLSLETADGVGSKLRVHVPSVHGLPEAVLA